MTYANGDVYDGDWKNGEQEGRGKMTFASGNVFNGEWKGGKQEGRGKMTYSSGAAVYDGNVYVGNVYEGEWACGMQHGRGKMTYANGNVFDGEWTGGKREGIDSPMGERTRRAVLEPEKQRAGRSLVISHSAPALGIKLPLNYHCISPRNPYH